MSGRDEGTESMLENPRHSIRSLSIPLTVAILISFAQNFIDTAWCSGLGASAISAITLSGPLYWIITDIGIGIGIGASTSIARVLGSGDKDHADRMVTQTIFITLVIAAASTAILAAVCDPVLTFVNDGGDISDCKEYVFPYLVFLIPIVLHGALIGILRAEGAGKMVLILSIVSTAVNIVIDPILIYTLGLGLTGAALATCISFVVPAAIGLSWYLSGRMKLRPLFRGFRPDFADIRDVMYVGIPGMIQMIALSLLMIPQNMLVLRTGGDAGVVLAMTPYKYILLTIIPAQGLAQAMVPVTSALQGAGMNSEAKDGFVYTAKLAGLICVILSVILIIAADPLMYLFTYSDEMSQYHDEITRVMRMYGIITVFAGMTEVCSSILQSLRKAMLATVSTIIRELVFIAMYIYASTVSMEAIYHSMITGMFIGLVLVGALAVRSVVHMDTKSEQPHHFKIA